VYYFYYCCCCYYYHYYYYYLYYYYKSIAYPTYHLPNLPAEAAGRGDRNTGDAKLVHVGDGAAKRAVRYSRSIEPFDRAVR
jgi:hypothetical protein